MKKLPILKVPHPVLRKKSKRVAAIDDYVKTLAQEMVYTLAKYEHPYEIGAAIAAPQVGELIKLIVVRKAFENVRDHNNPKKDFIVLINPEVVGHADEMTEDQEGCLSIPAVYGLVKRYKKITVEGLNLSGKKVTIDATGFKARVLQHEIDHLNGIVFTDRLEDMKKIYKMNSEGRLVKMHDG